MDDLSILPEGVREAIEELRSEQEISEFSFCNSANIDTVIAFAERTACDLVAARETIKRLNRRVQVAEAGIAEKVKESSGRNLGRALANAAFDMMQGERDEALAELAALKRRIDNAVVLRVQVHPREGTNCPDPFLLGAAYVDANALESLDGQRVALLPVGGE